MKAYFKAIFESKIFDGLVGVIFFLIIALFFDYATDEILTTHSFLLDLIFSLLLGLLIMIRPTGKKLGSALIKKRNEQVELIGKVLIGLLLFVTLLVLIIINT